MLKLFSILVAVFSVTAFSSAVIAHSMALPHNHSDSGLITSHLWTPGLISMCIFSFCIISLGIMGRAVLYRLKKP